MTESGRNYDSYRYGFNSQENVPKLGEGHTTALYWEYDGRLGRRWNLDPITKEYESNYSEILPYMQLTLMVQTVPFMMIMGSNCVV